MSKSASGHTDIVHISSTAPCLEPARPGRTHSMRHVCGTNQLHKHVGCRVSLGFGTSSYSCPSLLCSSYLFHDISAPSPTRTGPACSKSLGPRPPQTLIIIPPGARSPRKTFCVAGTPFPEVVTSETTKLPHSKKHRFSECAHIEEGAPRILHTPWRMLKEVNGSCFSSASSM